jgi:hypothetical protein
VSLNLTIPLVTLPADASRDFGPHTAGAGETLAMLTIDRTVAGGLNASPGVSADITFSVSPDGGSTWRLLASAGVPGGPITWTDRQGVTHPFTQSVIQVGLDQVQGLPVMANVTLHGGPLAVQGSFTVT